MSLRLTDHHFAQRGQLLPPVDESLMLDYIVGGNGTFARGRRPGLEVCMPIAPAIVRGLNEVTPYVQWGFPLVPAKMLQLMLSLSRHVARDAPREALFHLSFEAGEHCASQHRHVLCLNGWHLEFPEQRATVDEVELIHKGHGTSEARAIIEVHSHHHGEAYFSEKDDGDEGGCSFRVYGVLGTIFVKPTIRARIGLFGNFYQYPASEFFDMPEGLHDSLPGKG